MRQLWAPSALLESGWTERVRIDIDHAGTIIGLTPDIAPASAERLLGATIPGMPNLHSHAFQRAMTGLTERGGPQADSFWSWRECMYHFLGRLTPDDVQIIATQLYIEMLQSGYTAVAEFHYLHHDPEGRRYDDVAEMAQRIAAAAAETGIGLTLLPVLYQHGGFGGQPPNDGQKRFLNDDDRFARIVERCASITAPEPLQRTGVAPHSLRAVSRQALQAAVKLADGLAADAPIHIHAAEQQREVDDCIAWSGLRPAEWLQANVALDRRWCLIHATHLDNAETRALAASGAVAGLCPSTEGDLGDGFFNAAPYLAAQGAFGIGGDSHAGVDPFLELRWFEYGQRLRLERRNVLAGSGDSLGGRLYRDAALGGARALAQPVGVLAVGRRADLVVLDEDEPALIAHSRDGLLDAAIFGPARKPVRDVMVGGRWRVREGRHALAADSLAKYRGLLQRLLA